MHNNVEEYVSQMVDAYEEFTVDGNTSIQGVAAITRVMFSAPKEIRPEVLTQFEATIREAHA